jgi:Zn finger protein HypA/HybF involved in hydrogenase expression
VIKENNPLTCTHEWGKGDWWYCLRCGVAETEAVWSRSRVRGDITVGMMETAHLQRALVFAMRKGIRRLESFIPVFEREMHRRGSAPKVPYNLPRPKYGKSPAQVNYEIQRNNERLQRGIVEHIIALHPTAGQDAKALADAVVKGIEEITAAFNSHVFTSGLGPVTPGRTLVDVAEVILRDHAIKRRCKRCSDTYVSRGPTDLWCLQCTLARADLESGKGIAAKHSYVTPASTYREPIVTLDIDWD